MIQISLVSVLAVTFAVTKGSEYNYINESSLGCNGNVYWYYGDSTQTTMISIPLKGITNNIKSKMCQKACNNDINCNAHFNV